MQYMIAEQGRNVNKTKHLCPNQQLTTVLPFAHETVCCLLDSHVKPLYDIEYYNMKGFQK